MQEVERTDFSVFSLGSSCVAGKIEERNGLSSDETFSCGSTDCGKCVFNTHTLESWKGEGDE